MEKEIEISLSSLRLGEKLAEGGMATIHTAMSGDGQVVVRQLKPNLRFNPKMRKYFNGGIKVRRLCGEHPNIVRYLGQGGSMFSLPYEVIEFVPGKNLKSLIFGKNQAVYDHPLHILLQCAASMMHVHQVGYLHLDIKPENYFVTSTASKPVVKLSDFDLCQPVTVKEAPKGYGGSLMYVPPEFLLRKEISVGSDVFAFGVMAYNLYTNQMPFIGSVQSIMSGGDYSIKFPAGIEKRLPDEIRRIILRCLERHAKMRYKSGGDLFTALEKARRDLAYQSQKQQLA